MNEDPTPIDDRRSRRQRARMIHRQLRRRSLRDKAVLRAMARIPRHFFVPAAHRDLAYADGPVSIGYGQTISQPLIVAMMLQLLELKPEDRVLEIGAGCGYQAALLGHLVREVYAIEMIADLAQLARSNLARAEVDNVEVITGDGTLGFAPSAPYDGIIVAAAAPSVPPPLVEQLAPGGRLVIPVGGRFGQTLCRLRRHAAGVDEERLTMCAFVPLVGKYGWRSS